MSGSNGNSNGASGSNGNGARLYDVMASVLGVAPADLTDASSPDTVDAWDSLNHLNIVMALESEFSIELSPTDLFNMGDVAKIRTVLRDYGLEV